KVGVFLGSATSVVAGLTILMTLSPKQEVKTTDEDIEIRIDLPRFAEGFRVEPWMAQGWMLGRSLQELDLRNRCGISVLGAHRAGRDAHHGLEPVGASYTLREGDILLLVGTEEDIERFLELSSSISDSSAPPPLSNEGFQAEG
ncbi:MAG: TrkA C-terminal domain-containing protein, partial [Myxococcales bacterium]|nr:TrkA C-terminal domain-containing protein [Polyangiaceae bacterium]MDW8251468.1 TrkA C-terminal domain-containing protein [Myxococcales bacterium]